MRSWLRHLVEAANQGRELICGGSWGEVLVKQKIQMMGELQSLNMKESKGHGD